MRRTKLFIVAIVILLLVLVLLGGRSMYDIPPPDAPKSKVMSSDSMMATNGTSSMGPPENASMGPQKSNASMGPQKSNASMGPPSNNHDMDSMGLKEAITGYIPGLKAAPLDKMSLDTIWSKAKSGDHQAQCDFGKMLSSNTVNESDY
jgi:hypothetical protein